MMKPKVVLLIFVSGKIVLTGAKVREEIYMAFNQIYSVLVGESSSPPGAILWVVLTDPPGQNSEKRHSLGRAMSPCDSLPSFSWLCLRGFSVMYPRPYSH